VIGELPEGVFERIGHHGRPLREVRHRSGHRTLRGAGGGQAHGDGGGDGRGALDLVGSGAGGATEAVIVNAPPSGALRTRPTSLVGPRLLHGETDQLAVRVSVGVLDHPRQRSSQVTLVEPSLDRADEPTHHRRPEVRRGLDQVPVLADQPAGHAAWTR